MKRLKKRDLLLCAKKLIEKVPDPRNAKEHYESFVGKKNRKSVKQSETITYQPKTFYTVDIKSVITIFITIFKKIESEDKTKCDNFIQAQKQG